MLGTLAAVVFSGAVALTADTPDTRADTVIALKRTSINDGAAGTTRISLSERAVRIDRQGDEQPYTLIYRADLDLLWFINETKRSYTEFTREDLERVGRISQEAMKRARAQITDLPPVKRKKMEKLLNAQLGIPTSAGKTLEILKKGTDTINGHEADHFIGSRDDTKVVELWTVPAAKLGISMAERSALESMSRLFGDFADQIASVLPGEITKSPSWSHESFAHGIPVRAIHYRNGIATSRHELQSVTQEEMAPDQFDEPDELTERTYRLPG